MKEIHLPSGHVTIVDDDIYEWASNYKWHLSSKKYARTKIDGKWVFLHKVVLECPKGLMRDHVNGNRLDNRKENLRVVTSEQNARNRKLPKNNTTGYKGIRLEQGRWWRAFIGLNGKKKHLGYFKSAEDAAKAYDEAARKYYGEFARTNF